MPLRQAANLVNEALVDSLVGVGKAPADERLPMAPGDGPKRVMAAS